MDQLQYLISDIANSIHDMASQSSRFRLLLNEIPVLMELKKLNRDVRRFIKSRVNQERKVLEDQAKEVDDSMQARDGE